MGVSEATTLPIGAIRRDGGTQEDGGHRPRYPTLVDFLPEGHPYLQTADRQLTEREFESQFCLWLKYMGYSYLRQYRCKHGVADIVTHNTVTEVKLGLTRPRLFHAIGQALVYRGDINPVATPIVLTDSPVPDEFFQIGKSAGVVVLWWGIDRD